MHDKHNNGNTISTQNDPEEVQLIPLFHAWGDLLLSNHMATESIDRWVASLATRWTIQTAWSCFELACHLALGRNLNDPREKLSPNFWVNINKALARRHPPISPINHKAPPWEDWHLIQEERHPFAHLGAGGGRFPSKTDAQMAVDESEQAIKRFFSLLGRAGPRWLTASASWPRNVDPLPAAFAPQGGLRMVGSLTVSLQSAPPSDPATVRVAIINLDGSEACDYYPPGYDWMPRFNSLLNNLATPIKGIRVYDESNVYLDEPLLMWGGVG